MSGRGFERPPPWVPRFLLDEHVSVPACVALRERGVDVAHVLELGLAGAPDHTVLERATADGRIVVTRNYADFAILAELFVRRGRQFAGILFLPSSLAHDDVSGHVRALGRLPSRHESIILKS